jgi:uncharacterized membrane protein YozB (DUF420 family)
MKRILTILASLVGVFISLGFILPSIAKLQSQGVLTTAELLLVGVFLAFGSVGAAFYSIQKSRN